MTKPTQQQRAEELAHRLREKMTADVLGDDRRKKVDDWIKLQSDPLLDRAEAIRRLVDLGLKAKAK